MFKWSNVVKLFICFLSVLYCAACSAEQDLIPIKSEQVEWLELLQRLIPQDEYRVNYPATVRIFKDPGRYECEHQNHKEICKSKKMMLLISENEVNNFSIGYFTNDEYDWDVLSSSASGGVIKIALKKRVYSKDTADWYMEQVEFLFDSSSGKQL